MERKAYPSDVSDEEWAFVAPYLTLMREEAPQRDHNLREVFNGLRWIVRAGAAWRLMPHDLPPWQTVYQQTQRWLKAGCLEAMVHDLRAMLRLAAGRDGAAHRGHLRQSDAAIDPRKWPPGGLRRRQTPQGLESAYGGRHPGAFVGVARHPRRRTGPGAGRRRRRRSRR